MFVQVIGKFSREFRSTLAGVVAIVCWSSTFAVGRPLTESLGIMTSTSAMFLLGGLLGLAFYYSRAETRRERLAFPLKYLLCAGASFVVYSLCLYSSIGLVTTRQQVIEVSLINYLWPGLIVLFAVPIFKYRVSFFLPVGLLLSFCGAALSMVEGSGYSFDRLLYNLSSDTLAYGLAFLAAMSWAVYSNVSRLWGRDAGPELVCLFITLTGALAFPLRYLFNESSIFSWMSVWQLLYMAMIPTFLAYVFWDKAMKHGDIILVATLSFFTPLLSTFLSLIYLDLSASYLLWIACGLVLLGSYLAKQSVMSSADGLTEVEPKSN